jgi:hypothetical protein
MKKINPYQNGCLFLACCFLSGLLFTGCEIDKLNSDAKAVPSPESTRGSAYNTEPSQQVPVIIYTPRGNTVTVYRGSGCNCHAWAWSIAYGFPANVPDYQLVDPSAMYNDGSYRMIARSTIYDPIPVNVNVGDKVVYSYDNGYITHSAIVERIDPPLFRSYNIYSHVAPVGVVSKSPNFFYDQPNNNGLPYQRYGMNLTYYRIGKSTYRTGLPARKVAIRAVYNGKYVCADFCCGNSTCSNRCASLIANRDQALEWETFDLIDLGGGKAALWSYATGQFVSFHYAPYRANAYGLELSQYAGTIFTLVTRSNGVSYFRWGYPGREEYYVHYDSFEAGCIYTGPGSQFLIIDLP